ncbi:MAG TPA: hypothetical protein VM165_20300 [Planctomycetaceae bacterium]|nr:hypothetical protein [Planctomycetaceae bacterium]
MPRLIRQPGLTLLVLGLLGLPASGQTVGSNMVSFLNGKVGVRVGGGECAHMATEALRVSGGEFVPSDLGVDSPSSGDYVWGDLVTVISYASKKWTDSSPANKCQVGDIIQYGSAKFGKTSFPSKHTSVVTAVDATKSRPTAVLQQNFGGVRTVKAATINVTGLTAGWIRIYRPRPRVDVQNVWKFTTVNNTSTSQAYSLMVDTAVISSVSPTAANTAGSFRIHKVTTDGTVPCLVLSNGQSLFVTTTKGLELYQLTSGSAGVRQLSQ